MKTIEWTTIKAHPQDWIVIEKPSCFLARRARRGGLRPGPRQLVCWSSLDVKQAASFLRNAALEDRCNDARCEVCDTAKDRKLFYAYYGGHYCSEKCYDTLFLPCLECGQPNMECRSNMASSRPGWGGPENQLCNACHSKKHGWSVQTISFRNYR